MFATCFRKATGLVFGTVLLAVFPVFSQIQVSQLVVGKESCDTLFAYAIASDLVCVNNTLSFLVDSTALKKVSGMSFVIEIVHTEGVVLSNQSSDTVHAGDVFVVPFSDYDNRQFLDLIATGTNSRFDFSYLYKGTPQVAGEPYNCLIDVGMTVSLCDNYVGTGGFVDTTQCVVQPATGIPGKPEVVPQNVILQQNYPNPFNPETQIEFSIGTAETVSLRIFDLSGREVATLLNGILLAGVHTVSFDASNFTSGVYFYVLRTGSGVFRTGKMQLVK